MIKLHSNGTENRCGSTIMVLLGHFRITPEYYRSTGPCPGSRQNTTGAPACAPDHARLLPEHRPVPRITPEYYWNTSPCSRSPKFSCKGNRAMPQAMKRYDFCTPPVLHAIKHNTNRRCFVWRSGHVCAKIARQVPCAKIAQKVFLIFGPGQFLKKHSMCLERSHDGRVAELRRAWVGTSVTNWVDS